MGIAYSANKTIFLEKEKILIDNSVMNYQGKIVGLSVKIDEGSVYIPCYPSSYDIKYLSSSKGWKNKSFPAVGVVN